MDERSLPSKWVTPFPSKYLPWLEDSPELKIDGVQSFYKFIGQLCWSVDIGRVEILPET